jgi:DNA polymerase-3 subunit gamma/tau
MILALDYRPKTLAELAGNEALKRSFGAILKRPIKDIPHAFLFHGLTGGGKTTLGGILANHLKCDPFELYEINSANFRGIDTARDLDKNMRYAPMRGGVRIWVLNECHMWLKPAQNAMLDTIEKAPPHVYFVLTTTNPQNLIAPLRKRCVEYEVLPLTDDEMFNMLMDVVDAEKADVPESIVDKIISVSSGSSRNALQALEKVIDLDIKDMAKVSLQLDNDEAVAKDLFDAMIKKADWKAVTGIMKRITTEPESVRYSILGLANSMLLGGYGNPKQAALIIDCFKDNFYDSGKAGLTLATYSVII